MSLYPTSLANMSTREAITDAIHRAVIAIDVNDKALFESAFASPKESVSFEMNGQTTTGFDNICESVLDRVGDMDTTHYVTNVRIDVSNDAATTATASAYAQNQHFQPGKGMDPEAKNLLAGGRYYLDLVKDESDGLWKIKKWVFKIVWTRGDWSVMSKEK